jgi:hypothetical protein
LVDDIYLAYSIFINSINHDPQNKKEKYFATCQEPCHKDIKRAFSVLKQQFQILQSPIKSWYWEDIMDIMDVCILVHNMIIENHRQHYIISEYIEAGQEWYAATKGPFCATNNETNHPLIVSLFYNDEHQHSNAANILIEADLAICMAISVAHLNEEMKHQQEHFLLKNNLMNHLWARKKNHHCRSAN